MNNDFKKLDRLMRQATPPLSHKKAPHAPKTSGPWNWSLSLGFAALLAIIIFVALPQPGSHELLAMEEVLSWDVTADELLPELEAEWELLE